MRMLFVLMVAAMIPIGIYFYFYYRRTILFWSKKEKNKYIQFASILLAVCTTAACANMFYTPALVFLHVAAVQLVLHLLYLLIQIKGEEKKIPGMIYRCGLVPWLVTAVILGYGYFHMKDVTVKEYSVVTDKEISASAENGYTIAMLSDLHFGTTMDAEGLKEYCQRISAAKPDLVVLCGDIVDERTTKAELAEAMKVLGSIESRYGVYYVYGNHDSAQYASPPPFRLNELQEQLTSNGIRILEDEAVDIDSNLVLAGRLDRGFAGDDYRKKTEEILKNVDKNKYIVMLDHQPVQLEENEKSGVDLQISGHTHGGQIWPVGLISDLLGFGELNYGTKTINRFNVIVSSGIAGWGYPIRTGSNSEYLLIHITNKAE